MIKAFKTAVPNHISMAWLLACQTVVYLNPDVKTSYDCPKLEKKPLYRLQNYLHSEDPAEQCGSACRRKLRHLQARMA